MQKHLSAGLIYTPLRFFDLTPTGRALNRCLKDMATIDDRHLTYVDGVLII